MQLILLVNALMHHSKVLLLHRLRYVCFIARVPLVLARTYLVTGSISGEVVFLIFQDRRQVRVLVDTRGSRLLW